MLGQEGVLALGVDLPAGCGVTGGGTFLEILRPVATPCLNRVLSVLCV